MGMLYDSYKIYVLIVPLWNWNSCILDLIKFNLSSNRTFMELKWMYPHESRLGITGSNRTFMELKLNTTKLGDLYYYVLIVPLWNWNPEMSEEPIKALSSNRTFMELKFL